MGIEFSGWNKNVATFITDNNIKSGELVAMDGNFKVRAAIKGEEIIGVCIKSEDGFATIQLSGYIETNFVNSSAKVHLGTMGLSAFNSNTVMPNKYANLYRVIYVDEKSKTIGFLM